MTRISFLGVCLFIMLTVGCRQQTGETIIARVGEAALTLEDAKAHIDTTKEPYDDRINAYLNRWVEEEILYQEAIRKGFEKNEKYKKQIAEFERQIAIQDYLQEEVYEDTGMIDDEILRRYFMNHQSEFFVREDIARLNLMTFSSWRTASPFAAALGSSTSWDDAVNEILGDSDAVKNVIVREDNRVYTQKTLYPPELWRVASTLGPSEVSFPVKTTLGYTVLQVLEKVKSGSPATFDLAYDEVMMRFIIEERRNRYSNLLNRLRNNTRVEILHTTDKEKDSVYIPSP